MDYAIGYEYLRRTHLKGILIFQYFGDIKVIFILNMPLVIADTGLLLIENLKVLVKERYK
jgi:hypothetical protein